mmetsp:Transcript_15776/g.28410  ORF Transcript_15776/g.28410 Transcript_15776/m.28410 type:complete len:679 (+) Transcript_15776:122-2158(+)
MSVTVDIQTALQEEALELVLPQQTMVYHLKCTIAETWSVPALCQRLTMEADAAQLTVKSLKESGNPIAWQEIKVMKGKIEILELPNWKTLGECIVGSEPLLSLEMEETFDDAYPQLTDEDALLRKEAAQALAHSGSAKWVEAETPKLREAKLKEEERVKQAEAEGEAVKPKVIESEAERAIRALLPCLLDRNEDVRLAVLSSLILISPRGHEEVLKWLVFCLEDFEQSVREVAVDALVKLLEPRDAQNREGIRVRTKHIRAGVRLAALQAVRRTSRPGEEQAILAAAEAFEDHDEECREMAMRTLLAVAPKFNTTAMEQMISRLRIGSRSEIRCSALQVLMQIARKGDPKVLLAVAGGCEDPSPEVRVQALESLLQLAARGDKLGIDACVIRLGGFWNIPDNIQRQANRERALRNNEGIRERRRLKEEAEAKKKAEEEAYRQARIEAGLPEESEKDEEEENSNSDDDPGDLKEEVKEEVEEEVEEIREILGDQDWRVRKAAADGLGALALPGNTSVITTLTPCLEDVVAEVRRAVGEAFSKCCAKGDKRYLGILYALLAHKQGEVRIVALNALARLAFKSEKTSVEAVIPLMEDPVMEVRLAAMDALTTLAGTADEGALNAVLARLDDNRAEVRRAALEALPKVAWRKVQERVNAAAHARLGDRDLTVRSAAKALLES